MIIISCRENFDNPDQLKDTGHECREIDLNTDEVIRHLSLEHLRNELKNKRILILVHGYNNEQGEVHDAYSVVESKIQQHLSHAYDIVIGYSWPGGDSFTDWWSSKKRANAVARRFRFLLEDLALNQVNIDLMSHSLGARVVLKSLKLSHRQLNKPKRLIQNYYCLAAAVDNESLEKDEEFSQSINHIECLSIFHSKNDPILGLVYTGTEFDRALGYSGPEDISYTLTNLNNVYINNCKKIIKKHGAYKYSDQIYLQIDKLQQNKSQQFTSL